MSDTALNKIIQYGTAADRAAFVPDPAVGSQVLYIWFDEDSPPDTWVWDGSSWVQINVGAGAGITDLTGDVTATGPGSAVATIANDSVTYAKIQNVSTTDRILGRDTAGAGDIEELTVSGGLEFTGTGIQRSALTGDVTAAAGNNATTIANDAVTTVKILDSNVTLAKIADAAANDKLLGSGNAGAGSPYEEITLGTNLSMSGTTLNAAGGGGADPNLTYITEADETGDLPNSLQLVAGSNITFDTSTPNQLEINATGGAGLDTFSRTFTVDGGGAAITPGALGVYISIPVACTIIRVRLMADQDGDIEFDLFMDDPGSTYPPTTSIVAAAPPALSGADFGEDTTLTGWTTSVSAGDVIGAEVTSVVDIEKCVLQIDFQV